MKVLHASKLTFGVSARTLQATAFSVDFADQRRDQTLTAAQTIAQLKRHVDLFFNSSTGEVRRDAFSEWLKEKNRNHQK
jgi:hypothetical protein